MTASQGDREPCVAIAGIFKNEAPYILEWVAYHRAIGVTRFFVADNGSDDGTTEILAALQALGVLDHIPFPHAPGQPPQLPAYAEILKRHRRDADWIAFIDADEFLLPLRTGRQIGPILQDASDDVGALVVNWAIFGSSGLTVTPAGPVIERFERRAEQGHHANHHYKTIVRSAAVAHPGGNPHHFVLKSGFRAAYPSGEPMRVDPDKGPGFSEAVEWSTLRLNHYATKSRAEFIHKKSPRGSATVVTRVKRGGYFLNHDRNEVVEPAPPGLKDATRKRIASLKTRLREYGLPDRLIDVDQTIARLEDRDPHGVFENGRGYVDRSSLSATQLTLQGWAASGAGRPAPRFELRVGDRAAPATLVRRLTRADVARHFPNHEPDCGFRLSIEVAAIGREALLEGQWRVFALDPEFELTIAADATVESLIERTAATIMAQPGFAAMPDQSKRDILLGYLSGGATPADASRA